MAIENIEHKSVIIVGAGLSGINAAYRIQHDTPYQDDYTILEGRDVLGGTWSLFEYPGLRSDSDMYTLGFSFRPWTAAEPIADGPSILQYLKDTASEFGIDKKIQYNRMVTSSEWVSEDAKWYVNIEQRHPETAEVVGTTKMSCNFLYFCAGYYKYTNGFQAQLPGREKFKGTFIHPQQWPRNFDYSGKKIVIVGSGATAITLLPSMAPTAKHVTMLQRSPSYYVSLPRWDPISDFLRFILPGGIAHTIIRFLMTFRFYVFLWICKLFPGASRAVLRWLVKLQLPKNIPLDPHFNPNYKPWDQRVCVTPDGDFFQCLRAGNSDIKTDQIADFTENSIVLKSGETLEADVVVSATGLEMSMAGGSKMIVDGKDVRIGDCFIYKGQMLQDIPNMAICLGYTNASWSLGSDLAARYIARLINYMHDNGYDSAAPITNDGVQEADALLNLSSGYVQRAAKQGILPKAATKKPWYMRKNYFYDWFSVTFGTVEDSMQFKTIHKVK